jgi:type I restriction enzyme S subunit
MKTKNKAMVELRDILLDVRNGIYKHDDNYGRGVRILKMFNIGRLNGRWDLSRVDLVELSKSEHEAFKLQKGDILINRVNSRELVGKCAVINDDLDGSVYESKNMRIRLDVKKADPWFVVAWLNSRPGRLQFEDRLKQIAGMATINRSDIDSLKVPLPDLKTQQLVALSLQKRMSEVESIWREASVAHKTLPLLLDKTISEAFQGITPLSVGRDEAPPPERWHWHLLLDFARLATGHTPSRRSPEYWADGDIPWLALPDIRALDCRVATDSSEMTNAKGIANSSARVLPPGTVALSRTASVGYVTIFGREMATSQDFVNWVCGPKLHAPFLMWLLRASRVFIKGLSTGAVHQTVYMDVVERFRVCLPDLSTQKKIASRLDEAFRTIQQLQSAHKAQLEALDKLPGAYLREAFGALQD